MIIKIGIIQWFNEKIASAAKRKGPSTREKIQYIYDELDPEFRYESEIILASLPEDAREVERHNLKMAGHEATMAALDCLLASGVLEFAVEVGRANFHAWVSMARAER